MTLLFAIGNPHRGDDGVAAEVCALIGGGDWKVIETMELMPEMAADVAGAERLVFIDADYRGGQPSISPLSPVACHPGPMTHSLRPSDLVAVARRLYGFSGPAWLLRVPGTDFSLGSPLSETARTNSRLAAGLLSDLLKGGQPVEPSCQGRRGAA
ncbi:MAG: hydrogenase [Candidatus Solibacter sp.]|nr:hydrogenase [Candidatus Solibacter sp.]